jgi:PadR family transcriptional regulator PadR
MVDDALTRHFFTGFIRLHVLYHASREPIFGAEIAEELDRHGYRVSQGTLYPMLHELTRRGYLASRVEYVQGRKRKYYRATASGKKALAASRTRLRELTSEILDGRDAEFQTIRRKRAATPRKGLHSS